MQYQTFDRFSSLAKPLRASFDKKFANPLLANADRFVWDFWHVPDEYTVLRTPAFHYFQKPLYDRFHRQLVRWGREHLGCHDISPPWLSCYINGCRQEPHQDLPHGPLAFVYSLTNWTQRQFTGGETFIVRPRAKIEPIFNRLTIFNPACVHGVRKVSGTLDPRHGRLVIHGWFVNPRPFWVGPLQASQVEEGIGNCLSRLSFRSRKPLAGFISLRLQISKTGRVHNVKTLVETLDQRNAPKKIASLISEARFPPSRAENKLTLPLILNAD